MSSKSIGAKLLTKGGREDESDKENNLKKLNRLQAPTKMVDHKIVLKKVKPFESDIDKKRRIGVRAFQLDQGEQRNSAAGASGELNATNLATLSGKGSSSVRSNKSSRHSSASQSSARSASTQSSTGSASSQSSHSTHFSSCSSRGIADNIHSPGQVITQQVDAKYVKGKVEDLGTQKDQLMDLLQTNEAVIDNEAMDLMVKMFRAGDRIRKVLASKYHHAVSDHKTSRTALASALEIRAQLWDLVANNTTNLPVFSMKDFRTLIGVPRDITIPPCPSDFADIHTVRDLVDYLKRYQELHNKIAAKTAKDVEEKQRDVLAIVEALQKEAANNKGAISNPYLPPELQQGPLYPSQSHKVFSTTPYTEPPQRRALCEESIAEGGDRKVKAVHNFPRNSKLTKVAARGVECSTSASVSLTATAQAHAAAAGGVKPHSKSHSSSAGAGKAAGAKRHRETGTMLSASEGNESGTESATAAPKRAKLTGGASKTAGVSVSVKKMGK